MDTHFSKLDHSARQKYFTNNDAYVAECEGMCDIARVGERSQNDSLEKFTITNIKVFEKHIYFKQIK